MSWSVGGASTTGLGRVGVTEDGVLWANAGFNQAWIQFAGELLGSAQIKPTATYSFVRIIVAIDHDLTVYACGDYTFDLREERKLFCAAFSPHHEPDTWLVKLDAEGEILGGALTPGRLYIATEAGKLFLFGENEP
jgi:hypothetical protein